jgi:uncharacterized protein YggE
MKSILALAVLTAAALAGPASAADPLSPRTLTVTGYGIAKAAPDEAGFSTGVVAQGRTAAAALAANSKAMNAVIATLKQHGVPDKAIQTSGLNLSPQYQECKPNVTCPQKIVGYEVSNTVAVTVPLDKTGAVLDALVASGANQIGGISFSIHDTKPLLTEARTEAVKEALEKGAAFAKAAGVGLGPILSIQEAGAPAPQPVFRAMKAMAFDGGAPPIAGGEESVSANVSITWEIK